MSSEDALDETKQVEMYKEWQEYAFDQAFAIPTMYMYVLRPVSDRVVDYTIQRQYDANPWATIGVSAENRYNMYLNDREYSRSFFMDRNFC